MKAPLIATVQSAYLSRVSSDGLFQNRTVLERQEVTHSLMMFCKELNW